MREIKFRAWCEGEHESMTFPEPRMEYDVTIQDGVYASVEGGWDIQGTYPTIPLMQYTGLKDKNGVEIYEGDILRATNNGIKPFAVELERGSFVGEWVAEYIEKFEVIGNIWENGDLLNDKSN